MLKRASITAIVHLINILNVHFSVHLAASLDRVHRLLIVDLSHLLLLVLALHNPIVFGVETASVHAALHNPHFRANLQRVILTRFLHHGRVHRLHMATCQLLMSCLWVLHESIYLNLHKITLFLLQLEVLQLAHLALHECRVLTLQIALFLLLQLLHAHKESLQFEIALLLLQYSLLFVETERAIREMILNREATLISEHVS